MKSALGVDLRSGRCVRVWEDGRTEFVVAADVADAPDATALAVGEGLDAAAWREWATTRFGRDALDVAEDVAREYSDDLAAGAALWALEQVKRRVAAVPTVLPTVGTPPQSSDGPSMGDFGEGRSMSEFGDGQSMSDFAEPSRMSDFGDGRSMDEFGEGRQTTDFDEPAEPQSPTKEPVATSQDKPFPKARVAVAAAVTVVVVGLTAVVVAAAGRDDVPVATTSPTTEPAPTTTTTTVGPAERTFDVTFTITSTNADGFPDAPLKTGQTGVGVTTLSCDGDVCRFELKAGGGTQLTHIIGSVRLDGSSLEAVEQTAQPAQGLHGDCDRTDTRSIAAVIDGGRISGEGSFTSDPVTCPGPEQNTVHTYTFRFEGVEVTA